MSNDPEAVIRALIRAEAARSTRHEPEREQADRPHPPKNEDRT
ncbi:hypothetical protein ACFS5L_29585 [Streptomyces phyllanthi]